MKKSFKVFISQPFNGRKEIDILLEREVIKSIMMDKGMPVELLDIIDNYHKSMPKGTGRIGYLGDSIRQMDEADVVIFSKGYEKAMGCLIEYAVCKAYHVPYILLEELTTPTFNMTAKITEMNRYRIDRGLPIVDII